MLLKFNFKENFYGIYSCDRGINFVDFYSSNPDLRTNFGTALKELNIRENFVIEGYLCSTWKDGQYERTRDIEKMKEAFEDLLTRLQTDYIDIGMIHYIDEEKYENIEFKIAKDREELYELCEKRKVSSTVMKCYGGGVSAVMLGIKNQKEVDDALKFENATKAEKESPETVREHYKFLKHHASECIKCGRYKGNWPFSVSIIEKMEEAVEIFGV